MPYFSSNDAPALAIGKDVAQQLVPRIRQSTVAILGANRSAFTDQGSLTIVTGDPDRNPVTQQMGTATLLKAGSRRLLITAAHVLDKVSKDNKDNLAPVLWMPDEERSLIPMNGRSVATGEIADVAVVELNDTTASLINDAKFLSLDDVHLGTDAPNGWYFLHGFPIDRRYVARDLLTTTQEDWTYRTGLYAGRTQGFRDYAAHRHLLLCLDGESRLAKDNSPIEIPSTLKGMSGSSVWLGFSEHDVYGEWRPSHAKVVGVQTKVYTESRVARATRWLLVAMVLWGEFSDLRSELSTRLPPEVVERLQASPELN